jgi:hypothetical protein
LVVPELFEFAGPFVKRADGVGVGSVKHLAAVTADMDEANIVKHAEMLGDGWLCNAESRNNIADRMFLSSEITKDVAPARLGHGVEGI